MKVSEFVALLQKFPDQDAHVLVVDTDDDGKSFETRFCADEHLEYVNLNDVPWKTPGGDSVVWWNPASLLVGRLP